MQLKSLMVTNASIPSDCLLASFLSVAVPSVLSRHLLGYFPQVSNSHHRPPLFPAVKTTSCQFPTANLVSNTKKKSNSWSNAQ